MSSFRGIFGSELSLMAHQMGDIVVVSYHSDEDIAVSLVLWEEFLK